MSADKSANVAMRPLLPSRWDWMQPRHDRQDLAAFVRTATSRHEAHIDRSIRMRSRDVANLFSLVDVGTPIAIVKCNLREAISSVSSGSHATALAFAAN